MPHFKLILFDVDGVLLDSLGPHLEICRDKNKEFGLGLSIPDTNGIRNMVQAGQIISPMYAFFRAVGFPEAEALRADHDYQKSFNEEYPTHAFPGVDQMLLALRRSKFELGIVTSNIRSNIESALGKAFPLFNPQLVFTKDCPSEIEKAQAIAKAIEALGIAPSECLYVGDQPKDYEAALEANAAFLGVTYGWGISSDEHRFPTVGSIGEIAPFVAKNA